MEAETAPGLIACFLNWQAYRERVTRIRVLMEQAMLSRERLDVSSGLFLGEERSGAGIESTSRA